MEPKPEPLMVMTDSVPPAADVGVNELIFGPPAPLKTAPCEEFG